MKDLDLLRAFGEIDDQYIEEAELAAAPKKRRIIRFSRPLGTAAVVLAATFIFYIGVYQPDRLTSQRTATKEAYGPQLTSSPLTDASTQTVMNLQEADEELVLADAPVTYYENLQEAEEALGFSAAVPESYAQSKRILITSSSEQTLTVIYTDGNGETLLQLTKESNAAAMLSQEAVANEALDSQPPAAETALEYAFSESIPEPIFYRDDNNRIQSAQWVKDGFTYTLEFTDPVTDETANALVQEIQ